MSISTNERASRQNDRWQGDAKNRIAISEAVMPQIGSLSRFGKALDTQLTRDHNPIFRHAKAGIKLKLLAKIVACGGFRDLNN